MRSNDKGRTRVREGGYKEEHKQWERREREGLWRDKDEKSKGERKEGASMRDCVVCGGEILSRLLF